MSVLNILVTANILFLTHVNGSPPEVNWLAKDAFSEALRKFVESNRFILELFSEHINVDGCFWLAMEWNAEMLEEGVVDGFSWPKHVALIKFKPKNFGEKNSNYALVYFSKKNSGLPAFKIEMAPEVVWNPTVKVGMDLIVTINKECSMLKAQLDPMINSLLNRGQPKIEDNEEFKALVERLTYSKLSNQYIFEHYISVISRKGMSMRAAIIRTDVGNSMSYTFGLLVVTPKGMAGKLHATTFYQTTSNQTEDEIKMYLINRVQAWTHESISFAMRPLEFVFTSKGTGGDQGILPSCSTVFKVGFNFRADDIDFRPLYTVVAEFERSCTGDYGTNSVYLVFEKNATECRDIKEVVAKYPFWLTPDASHNRAAKTAISAGNLIESKLKRLLSVEEKLSWKYEFETFAVGSPDSRIHIYSLQHNASSETEQANAQYAYACREYDDKEMELVGIYSAIEPILKTDLEAWNEKTAVGNVSGTFVVWWKELPTRYQYTAQLKAIVSERLKTENCSFEEVAHAVNNARNFGFYNDNNGNVYVLVVIKTEPPTQKNERYNGTESQTIIIEFFRLVGNGNASWKATKSTARIFTVQNAKYKAEMELEALLKEANL